MKNAMRVISVLLAFAAIVLIIAVTFDTGVSFLEFSMKVLVICLYNILPIISIAICAYCMERNDTNYLVRIIPVYMSVPILITIIMMLFETNVGWLVDTYTFMSKTFLTVTVLSIILVIKPNNQITTILSYLAYGLLAANFIIPLVTEVSDIFSSLLTGMLRSSYYSGLSLYGNADEFMSKMYAATTIAQFFVVILLYTTNYAFSDKIELEADAIDYEAVKEDAMNAAQAQMNSIYNSSSTVQTTEPDRSASEKGLMNINNQLGQDSNVGTVKSQAREMNVSGSTLDSLLPLSSGPVINSNNEQPAEQQNTVPQETTPVQETIPPNMDIQEQMKMRMQQQNNQNNQ